VASIRFLAALIAGVCISTIVLPTNAQPSRARSSADVDLPARLKEVERDPKLFEDTLKIGRKAAAVCANCHGETGNSPKPDTPNLAGQNPAYLIEQLRKFVDGRRRFEFMEGMIKSMTSDEKIGIVLYYSNQKVTVKPASNLALAAKGKEYFNKICFRCHGNDGRGNEQFARIAGQQPDYLRVTLQRYRAATGVRNDPLMSASTKLMTDADIDAIVSYVGALQ